MATLRQEKRGNAFNDGRLEAGVSPQIGGGLYWPVRHCLNAMVFLTWFPNYLTQEKHITALTAGFMTTVPFMAAFLG